MIDPLAGLQVDVKSFDVGRIASVYFDSEGNRCWSKDSWLTRFWPKQMSVYHKAIEQTRQQLLGL